jgi:hypothetical protein
MPVPVGAVTVIVPVAKVHVGCAVTLAVGAAGVGGCAEINTRKLVDTQPALFFAVTLYAPGETLVNKPSVFV